MGSQAKYSSLEEQAAAEEETKPELKQETKTCETCGQELPKEGK